MSRLLATPHEGEVIILGPPTVADVRMYLHVYTAELPLTSVALPCVLVSSGHSLFACDPSSVYGCLLGSKQRRFVVAAFTR